LRRSWAHTCGILCFTVPNTTLLANEVLHQLSECQKILYPDQRASLPNDHLWIGSDEVGPLPRHRAYAIRTDAQQEPHSIPVIPLAGADELLSAERVKRVRHAHKTRRCVRRACNLC
jgi:hypothetical protein